MTTGVAVMNLPGDAANEMEKANGLPAGSESSTSTDSNSSPSHFNDWPNAFAFDTDFVQNEPIELKVTGNIPTYAAGTLYRIGPGANQIKCDNGKQFKTIHWFDGFAVIHRFHIEAESSGGPVKVIYNSRCTADKLVEHIRKTGRFKDFGFAQKRDPCQSFFKKMMSLFMPKYGLDPEAVNVSVALTPDMPGIAAARGQTPAPIKSITARTDVAKYQTLDPETLEPAGVCDQTTLNPNLKGAISATHAKTCPLTGDVFNYNLDVGRNSVYRVFHASAATGQTQVLAEIEAPPAYLHSIFLTQNTVVLCIWNSHFAYRGAAILWHRNVLDSIAPLDAEEPARWYVVDRSPARRGLLATFHTPAFFCFHTINAYEEPSSTEKGKTDIIADLVTYPDLSVLHRFYYNNLVSTSADAVDFIKRQDSHRGNFSRYRLPDIPILSSISSSSKPTLDPPLTEPRQATLLHSSPKNTALELPTLSPLHHTRKYRYHYGISDTGLSTFFDGIGKYDSKTNKTQFWRTEGHTPGEPIFVPSPEARVRGEALLRRENDGEKEVNEQKGEEEEEVDELEDDGVLLSVVLDGKKEESYLLVLDARTMEEVGRAEMAPSGSSTEGEAHGKGEGAREQDGEMGRQRRMVVGMGFHGVHVPLTPGEGVVAGGE